MAEETIVVPVAVTSGEPSPVAQAQESASVAQIEATTAVVEAQAAQAVAEAGAATALAAAVAENAEEIIEAETEEIDDVWLEEKFSGVRSELAQLRQEVMAVMSTMQTALTEMAVNLSATLTLAKELRELRTPVEPQPSIRPALEPSSQIPTPSNQESAEENPVPKTRSKTKSIRL